MDPMTMALIASAAMGMMKSKSQGDAYNKQVDVESMKERWAPFTGQRGQSMRKPDAMDPLMQSLVTGAMIGQQFGDKPVGPVTDPSSADFVGPPAGQAGPLPAQPGSANFVGPPMAGSMPSYTSSPGAVAPTNASYFARRT